MAQAASSHADPGLHKNTPLWTSGPKISWRTPADKQRCPWSLPLTTDPLIHHDPHAFAGGERAEETRLIPAATLQGPTLALPMEKGAQQEQTGWAWAEPGAAPVRERSRLLGGLNANRASTGAPAAKAGCYVLRVKATTRGRKPPWKYTWQTVMAP